MDSPEWDVSRHVWNEDYNEIEMAKRNNIMWDEYYYEYDDEYIMNN